MSALDAFPQCIPAAGQVAVFEHSNYEGRCSVRGAGNYGSSSAIGLANDIISSIRVGAGAEATLCEHINYGGRCQKFTADKASFSGTTIGHDRASSMRVGQAGVPMVCIPSAQQVALFENKDFGGACVVRNIGEYRNAIGIQLANDTVTSVQIGSAVEALLCIDDDYLGDCELFPSARADLSGTRTGNDRVSSLVVRPRGTTSCIPGANEVSVYIHQSFEGACVVKPRGEYATPQAIGIANDAVSSARLGADVQLVACVDAQYGKDCEILTGSVPDFRSTRVGQDRLSSMKVQSRGFRDCVPTARQGSLYVHGSFVGPCVAKDLSDYPDSNAIGLPNDSISSVRVGGLVQVCACVDPEFRGRCEAFTSDDPDLRDNLGNDVISSVRVMARGADCAAPAQNGFSQVQVSNCHTERRRVFIWVHDETAGGAWTRHGDPFPPQFSGGACPVGPPFGVALPNGHFMRIAAVDPQNPGCGDFNAVVPACIRALFGPFLGQTGGSVMPVKVN